MFGLMQTLTSSMAAFSTTPLESCSSSYLETLVLGEKALKLKNVLSHAAVKLQKSLSDLVKLKRESQHQSWAQHSLILL